MRIALLGATSQIARDLLLSLNAQEELEILLYARRPEYLASWLNDHDMQGRYQIAGFSAFSIEEEFDAIINFVGVGNPVQTTALGIAIIELTRAFDELVLDYLSHYPRCRYLFLSSGAVYGTGFDKPVDEQTRAEVPLNQIQPQDWYALAKLQAECRHRSLSTMAIVDIRVFNYFSNRQDMTTGFLMGDIVRAIQNNTVLHTSSDYIVRDYLHPSDFYRMITALLHAPPINTAVDCYSKAHIDKTALLAAMQKKFGLRFDVTTRNTGINATGNKPHYYSLNRRAATFGYEPELTSLEGLYKETSIILNNPKS
ncbi:NAD(P)-dependent oxidoreductase [Undibacterium sp. CY18W]|uniref:NAD(P)-dependent oxidoreductase n=1 Tax=Undibacterium hunanense TaxID=2762292 RepID=A0ABR6ZQ45_9BURK|nr:NAD(P)-dependent oxidoreductase [Undibacterium hunanense]MBC3917989.1 NAD(P)-dependent oxidoreductase [Undibacterium hunanense]